MKKLLNGQSLLLFAWLLVATPLAVQPLFVGTTNNGTITITGYTGTNGAVNCLTEMYLSRAFGVQ